MFPGNRVGAVMFTILMGLLLLVVALLMFNLGEQNAKLELENQNQDSLIQELITQNRGPRGDDGLSAYEIWLSLGNEGSEQDFIDSLRGKPGTNGIDGRDADPAKPGANGLSVGTPVCTGTSLEWYLTNGKHIGTTKLVCLK